MATKSEFEAALAQAQLNLANLEHAKAVLPMQRAAQESRHKAQMESLDREEASIEDKLSTTRKQIAEAEKALAEQAAG